MTAPDCDPARTFAGFRGEILDMREDDRACSLKLRPVAQSAPPPDVDLTDMAGLAMHHLVHNPLRDYGYQYCFDVDFLR